MEKCTKWIFWILFSQKHALVVEKREDIFALIVFVVPLVRSQFVLIANTLQLMGQLISIAKRNMELTV